MKGHFQKIFNIRSTFDKIFIFFIIIIILSIIPIAMVCQYANHIIVNKQIEVNKNYISTVTNFTDNIFKSAISDCFNVMQGDNYNKYLQNFKKYDENFTSDSLKLIDDLKKIRTNNGYIKNIAIYSVNEAKKEEYVLSEEGSYEPEVYFNRINSERDYSYEYWNKLVKNDFSIKILPGTLFTANINFKSSVSPSEDSYLSNQTSKKIKLPSEVIDKEIKDDDTKGLGERIVPVVVKIKYPSISPLTFMKVDIDENTLYNINESINITKNGYVYIFDAESNRFINTIDELGILKANNYDDIVSKLRNEDNNSKIKLNKDTLLMTYNKSNINNLYYIVLTPEEMLTKEITAFLKKSFFTVIFFLLVAIFLSMFFTKNIYVPLKNTITYVRNVCGISEEHSDSQNEYEFLKNSFGKMQNIHNSSRFTMMNTLVYRAVNYNLTKEEAEKLVKDYHLPLNKKHFVIFNIRTGYVDPNNESKEVIDKQNEANANDIRNIFSVLGEFVEVNTNSYALLMNFENEEEFKYNYEQLQYKVNTFLYGKQNLKVFVSHSDIFDEIIEAHRFYQQAYNILDMKNINLNKVFYEKQDNGIDDSKNYFNDEKRLIRNYLINCNKEETLNLIQEVLAYCKQNNMALMRYRQFINEFILIAIDVLSEKQIEVSSVIYNIEEILQSINIIQRPEVLEEKCIYIYNEVLNSLIKQKGNNSTIKLILEYIDDNLETVNLNEVADKFNMNANYLSQYFKKHMDMTFTNYLNMRKVEISKEKLINSNKTVEVIGKEVGFSNASTFIRAFKNIEGITPNTFRENNLTMIHKVNPQSSIGSSD